MIVLDEAGRIVDTNPAARGFMGAGSADPLGARLDSLMPILQLPAAKDGEPWEVPLPDGRKIGVRLSRVIAGDGTSEGAVILLRDITAERIAQEELLRAQEQLRKANRELEKLASTDPLTGLANRRSLMKRSDEEFARARRHQRPLSFVMMDIDHFKQINDGYGHATGDRVLEQLGRALQGLIRPGDLAARLGGEEFGVLLPDTTLAHAFRVSRRLRSVLRALSHEAPDGSTLPVRLSLGVATLRPADAGPADLMSRADAALYWTKSNGRDGISGELESGFDRLPDTGAETA
jgi:diguanylate cyclase (GGDEF)-like protein